MSNGKVKDAIFDSHDSGRLCDWNYPFILFIPMGMAKGHLVRLPVSGFEGGQAFRPSWARPHPQPVSRPPGSAPSPRSLAARTTKGFAGPPKCLFPRNNNKQMSSVELHGLGSGQFSHVKDTK